MGPSAAGKETFIKSVASDTRTLQLLNIDTTSVVACGASYHFNGSFKGDVIDEAREKIFDEIPDLLENYDVVLIKWQHIDTDLQRPERLQALLPQVEQRALLLVAPQAELADRLPGKFWWHTPGRKYEHSAAGIKQIETAVAALPKAIPVKVVLSSIGQSYSVIETGGQPVSSLYYADYTATESATLTNSGD
jgi:hypothetical protein